MPRKEAAVQQVEPPGGQRRRRDMPLLMGYLEKRHRKQMRRTVRDAFSCQKAGHIRTVHIPGTCGNTDAADRIILQKRAQPFQQFRELTCMVKHRIALPQSHLADFYRQELLFLVYLSGLQIQQRR